MAAKGKGKRRRGKQGVVSWITSIIALIIGLFPVWTELAYWAQGHGTFGQMGDNLQRFYNPLRQDQEALKVGYGSMIGGLAFKIGASELIKRAKIRSAIPELT